MQAVGAWISGRLFAIAPTAEIAAAAEQLARERISHLLVMDSGVLRGILCVCDIDRAQGGTRVAEAMSSQPWTIEIGAPLTDALARMREHRVSCLPVVEGTGVRGVITLRDLVRLGVADEDIARCRACGSEEHVRCPEHGLSAGFCLECTRRSEPPASDDELGGG